MESEVTELARRALAAHALRAVCGSCAGRGCQECQGAGVVCPRCRGARYVSTGWAANVHPETMDATASTIARCDMCCEGGRLDEEKEQAAIVMYIRHPRTKEWTARKHAEEATKQAGTRGLQFSRMEWNKRTSKLPDLT